MKYIVLYTDKPLPEDPNQDVVFEGRHNTLKDAEAHIRKSAAECTEGGFESGDEDWGGRYTILQTVKTVRPIPTVKITLKEVEE